MSKVKIEVAVPASKISLGEEPHWVEGKQELLYVDVPGQAIRRCVPSTGANYALPRLSFPSESRVIAGAVINPIIRQLKKEKPSLIVPVESADNYL